MSRHPLVKWAQRSAELCITVELPDAKNVKLNLDPEGKFYFSATSGVDNIPYELDIDLFDKVDVNESESIISSRNVCYIVKKAESKRWSRLLKQDGKPPVFLKVDWDKWVDEDEEDENSGDNMDFNDFDLSKLNMAGAGDFDGEDADGDEDEESDTDEESKEEATAANGGAVTNGYSEVKS